MKAILSQAGVAVELEARNPGANVWTRRVSLVPLYYSCPVRETSHTTAITVERPRHV